eukprot:gene9734-9892_t
MDSAGTGKTEEARKVPASISSKSRDELENLALNLLKTLKQKDKRIAELTAATTKVDTEDAGDPATKVGASTSVDTVVM